MSAFVPLLIVGQSSDVIQGHIVKFSQGNGMMEGDLSLAPLIEGILLHGDIEDSGDGFLWHIFIFSQIF